MNKDELGFEKDVLNVTFYEITAGRESEIFGNFSKLFLPSMIFKALGGFDLVTLQESEEISHHPSTLISSPSGVSPVCSNILFKWSGFYSSPDMQDWILESPIIGLTYIELDKSLFKYYPSTEIIERIIRLIYNNKFYWKKSDIALFCGHGTSEICIFIKCNDFKYIFEKIIKLRSLSFKDILPSLKDEQKNFPIICKSSTIPLISYREVIIPKCYNLIKGKSQAIINISCPPGLDVMVKDKFKDKENNCFSIFGEEDLVIVYKKPIQSEILVDKILTFRESFQEQAHIKTATNLLSPDINPSELDYYRIGDDSFSGLWPFFKNQQFTEPNQKPLSFFKIPKWFVKKYPDLADKARNLLEKIHTRVHDSTLFPIVFDLISFPFNLGNAIENCKESDARRDNPVSELTIMLECVETALLQRLEGKIYHPNINNYMTSRFNNGIFSSVLAIHTLVNHIYELWQQSSKFETETLTETNSLYSPWFGFIFCHDIYQFSYKPKEIFSLPHKALYYPLSKDVNWMILSHEISHTLFNRIDIFNDDKFENNIRRTFTAKNESQNLEDIPELDYLRDQICELFANWFDYYHFYNRDHGFYQKCIWESWIYVPIVRVAYTDYFLRSFFIYVWDQYENSTELLDNELRRYAKKQGDCKKFFDRTWKSYKDFMNTIVPHILEQFDLDNAMQKAMQESITNQALRLLVLLLNKFEQHKNDSFREKLNLTYDRLTEDIEKICKGVILKESIPNPFLLVRETLRRCFNDNSLNNVSIDLSLIHSLKNLHIISIDEEDKDE